MYNSMIKFSILNKNLFSEKKFHEMTDLYSEGSEYSFSIYFF